MPKDCPSCGHALEELVQEIRNMKTKNTLAPHVAAKMEGELQQAIAESKKDTQDLVFILGKLNRAKSFIDGDASASGLLRNFTETIALVNRHLP